MFFGRKTFVILGVVLALMMSYFPFAVSAAVIAVSPSTISDDVATIITVTGDGTPAFDATSKIYLDGVELSGTLLMSATELRVTVPAGTSIGQHIITVSGSPGSVVLTVAPPVPTATSVSTFSRPQIQVTFSGASAKEITSKKPFKFSINFQNAGSTAAYNAQVTFTSADLAPLETGGVIVLGNLGSGDVVSVDQRFVSQESLSGKSVVTIDATVTYYDDKGTTYSDKFTFTISVEGGGSAGSGVYYTATPTGVRSGQLIITSYGTTVDPLQPGSQFKLVMTVQNLGNDKAQRVTMIVGGGGSGGASGTPQPGGVSGGSGEFSNFAPVGSSNLQSLGDLAAGGMVQASQELIVNVSTNPGAYPMKITFSYLNSKGEVVNDEQVITLLVFGLPNVDISFYRPPDLFFAGQPGALPIQVVNLGKRTSVLGNITITSNNGLVENGTGLIGNLDAGGYFTLDAMFYPDVSGKATLNVHIDYTDDFNQPRSIDKTLEVNVEEAFIEPTPDPNMPGGGGGEVIPVSEESFLQKAWRFILGLLGLDSTPPASSPEFEVPQDGEQVPLPSGGGKG
ncbi:MAG TPA: hypothetical protein PK078_10970 [Anaerolineales bacterium]|nr:hypothetical protein [Anaerolineales bacterium]